MTKKPRSYTESSPPIITLLEIINFLGGALVFLGIAFLVSINWFSLNSFLKIALTLGSGIAAYLMGILIYLNKKYETLGTAFFLIAALTLPLGLYVSIDTLNLMNLNDFDKINALITAICLCIFLFSHLLYPRTIFLLFIILFASGFFISLINYLTLHPLYLFYNHVFDYQLLFLGCCYILLGRYLDRDKKFPLTEPLYFFGLPFILSASYSLAGIFNPIGSSFWKVITALLIIASFFLAVPLKSKSFLYWGGIFLVVYLTDLSSQFVHLFGPYGWPLLLIFLGFLFMFTGYWVRHIHKKITRLKKPS